MGITYIDTAEQLAAWADRHGLRPDWHEPDEQEVGAVVIGTNLDNAFGAQGRDRYADEVSGFHDELRVVLITDADGPDRAPSAVVNLASLLAWASDRHRAAVDAAIMARAEAVEGGRPTMEDVGAMTDEQIVLAIRAQVRSKQAIADRLQALQYAVADAFGQNRDRFTYEDALAYMVEVKADWSEGVLHRSEGSPHDKGRDCARTDEVLEAYRSRAVAAERKLAAAGLE